MALDRTDHGRGVRAERGPEDRVWVVDRAGLREIDRLSVEEYGLPSIVLMENACAGLADETLAMLEDLGRREVDVFCGPGNNGGDGLGAARHLANADAEVEIVLVGHAPTTGDAAVNLEVCRRMGLALVGFEAWAERERAERPPAVVVDALFGTGLTRPVGGVYADAVREINALCGRGARVVAADIPSGLDADTGAVLCTEGEDEGVCVRADLTVTFAALKPGFGELEAQEVLGEVTVVPIGCPSDLLDRFGRRLSDPPGADATEPVAGDDRRHVVDWDGSDRGEEGGAGRGA